MSHSDWSSYTHLIPWVEAAGRPLPGIQPLGQSPLFLIGEDYADQMHTKRALISERKSLVLAQAATLGESTLAAVYNFALSTILTQPGFERNEGDRLTCPDGVHVKLDPAKPLETLGNCIQEDICVMEKRDTRHVLTAALLTFPAGWRLSEKIGKPLDRIHAPVREYPEIARRVQRLFDGVQEGRPLWRANALWYAHNTLYAPLGEDTPRAPSPEGQGWLRSERQVIARVPGSQAVVFIIRTMICAGADARVDQRVSQEQV
ncbi:MAG: DUF3445 domain-containing protein [Pseudomonadota bacterium]